MVRDNNRKHPTFEFNNERFREREFLSVIRPLAQADIEVARNWIVAEIPDRLEDEIEKMGTMLANLRSRERPSRIIHQFETIAGELARLRGRWSITEQEVDTL